MWVEKYRPKTATEAVGNEEAKVAFLKWLTNKRRKKAVLLYGPPGVGKTALVYAAAHDLTYHVIEMNASDTRTDKTISEIADPAVSMASLDTLFLDGKGNLLLFDEVDGIFGREDLGGVGAIVKIIKKSQIPIVLTANNQDIQKLHPITRASELIKFREVRAPLLVALLQKICQTEGVTVEQEALEVLAKKSRGDVRSAINDLQTLCEGKNAIRKEDVQRISVRNRDLTVYQTLRDVFSAVSPQEARMILNNAPIKYDTLLLALHDNLPLRYRDPEILAAAYDILSSADVFMGKIGNELWRLLPYVYALLAQSVTIAPQTFRPFHPIFPPTRFSLLSWSRSERATLESICAKIGARCHVSKRSANLNFVRFLQMLFKKESDQTSKIAAWLGLGDDHLEYLRELT